MLLQNSSARPVALIRAQSSVADVVELHTHTMDQGVMRMRQVDEITVQGNDKTHLKPGGYHVMLIGLKQDLKSGDQVTLRLYFSNGEMAVVDMPVKSAGAGMRMGH